jgi:hypothetical protein
VRDVVERPVIIAPHGRYQGASAERFAAFSNVLEQMSSGVPYVPLYLSDFTVALSSKFSYPGFNYWFFGDDNYLLGIKAAR